MAKVTLSLSYWPSMCGVDAKTERVEGATELDLEDGASDDDRESDDEVEGCCW